MRPLSLVTQLANLAGVGYNDNNVVIMRRIIVMVDERHGGGYATRYSNRRYVVGVFDEIMSRHGSSFETLTDVLMRAHQQYKDDASVEDRGGWGGLFHSHSPPIVEL